VIKLLTPYDPGDLDPGAVYTHAEVLEVSRSRASRYLRIRWCHGTAPEGRFVPGLAGPRLLTVVGKDFDAFEELRIQHDDPQVGLSYGAGFDLAVEQYLIDSGTVVGEGE
jgi:hypothetical protein